MARQLRALHDAEMISTSTEARAAALQYVRVVTGSARPRPEHREVFEETVLQVAVATQKLIDGMASAAEVERSRTRRDERQSFDAAG
ncbi:DUF2277 family protein [Arsenicicoccus bolidensis]|uniref:DUF2277 domain-containing protein n=1 Tax=Arsenicicoccus bolidensis TaxID=229480 RepID=A0ABS9Q681_9MICO|nr:DUF2277 family protein [Arsenicicoccus bolidensis]MCG7323391.1 DUF2277 domain-containing protein [Arsenicicoccus bolidensis]